jgi:hypothetical protein
MCAKLIAQFKTAASLVGDVVKDAEQFMKDYKVEERPVSARMATLLFFGLTYDCCPVELSRCGKSFAQDWSARYN